MDQTVAYYRRRFLQIAAERFAPRLDERAGDAAAIREFLRDTFGVFAIADATEDEVAYLGDLLRER